MLDTIILYHKFLKNAIGGQNRKFAIAKIKKISVDFCQNLCFEHNTYFVVI
jgi:hypothetical protein